MSSTFTRQIVLDTETTGINKFGIHYEGHRIVEIGSVELINRCLTNNQFHVYINPNRSIDLEAYQIHGISDQFLINKPTFSEIVDDFLKFITGSELIIHNAPFDLGFINHELSMVSSNYRSIESLCQITDTLRLARNMFPGQRNNLDALCDRYFINNDHRVVHNALVDAKLLAHVFLSMTGGQMSINFKEVAMTNSLNNNISANLLKYDQDNVGDKLLKSKIIYATQEEKLAHTQCLDYMKKIK